jgi:hypothetical protein
MREPPRAILMGAGIGGGSQSAALEKFNQEVRGEPTAKPMRQLSNRSRNKREPPCEMLDGSAPGQ